MTPDDRAFDKVSPGSLRAYDCSPDLDGDPAFRGLRVHAPRRVLFGPGTRDPLHGCFARVLLCGSYHLDANYLGLRGWFLPALVLVAVDARTHRAFSGTMDAVADAISRPDEGLPDDVFARRSLIEHWNPNLARVLSLPEAETDYFAYAMLGDHVSNVVRIEVRHHDSGVTP